MDDREELFKEYQQAVEGAEHASRRYRAAREAFELAKTEHQRAQRARVRAGIALDRAIEESVSDSE